MKKKKKRKENNNNNNKTTRKIDQSSKKDWETLYNRAIFLSPAQSIIFFPGMMISYLH